LTCAHRQQPCVVAPQNDRACDANSKIAKLACQMPANSTEFTFRRFTSSWEERHAQDLGKEHLVKRSEGNVCSRRVEASASAHRHWRTIRQEQGASLPCHESQWPCSDARGGRWFFAVGIKLHHSVSRRQAWRRHVGTVGSAGSCARE